MPVKAKKEPVAAKSQEEDVLDKEVAEVEASETEEEVDPLDDVHEEEAPTEYSPEKAQPEEKKGPKINFDYQEPEVEKVEEPQVKKEETLADLAQKYKDEPEVEVEKEVEEVENNQKQVEDAPEAYIPQMKAQMPTSGIYSAQDVRKGDGQLHQAPYMKSSFTGSGNGTERPNKNSKLHFVILALIGLAVLGSAVYLLKYQFKPAKPVATPSPAPVVVSTPAPTPTPAAIDRSKYTLRVLNGTDTPKLASSVSATLKGLGYKIDKSGNAPASIDQTTIKAQPNNDELIKQLTTDLAGISYQASSSSAALKSNDAADAEVTIGAK